MKKNVLALFLAVMMVLSLAACGSKEETPAETPDVETEEVAPEVADPDVGVPAEPTEEPDVPAVMPEVDVEEGEVEMPTVTPEVEAPAEKPEEQPAPEQKPAETPAEKPAAGQSVDLNAFYVSLTEKYGENFPANMNVCEMQEMLDGFFPGLSAIGTKQLMVYQPMMGAVVCEIALVETYGENFPANMNLCDMQEMLDTYYPQLSGIDTKQMMIYQPMMGAVVCEIALVEVTNAADVETVKTILQGRIDEQVNGGAWYPESIEGWKNNSRIAVNGNYVMMIAYSECDAVVDAFNGLFA